MIRKFAAAAIVAVILAPPAAHAFGGSWQCENQMDMDQDEARDMSANNAMFNIVNQYREIWDANHVLQQCEAYATGQPYEISCLNDRRDWDAIKAMIPSEYFGMSNPELTPHFHELQLQDDGFAEAFKYCRSVGAIK